MKAVFFTILLSLLFAAPAFLGARRRDKRGLVLIALATLVALDVWIFQTPRVTRAVQNGGGLADWAILSVGAWKVGALDVAAAAAIIAALAAIGSTWVAALAAQLVAFIIGPLVAGYINTPLPGMVFILAFALPFVWATWKKWAEMPDGDKVQTAVVCSLALAFALAGVAKALC
jgi:hypothetical protein